MEPLVPRIRRAGVDFALIVMAKSPPGPSVQLAIQQYEAGLVAEAEKTGRQVLARQPKSIEALHLLSVIALQQKKYAQAEELTRKAIVVAPGHAAIHSNHGEACRRLGRLEQAVGSFQRALSLQPDHVDALNNLGVTLTEIGRFDESIAALQRLLALKPDFARGHYNLGVALTAQQRATEAIASFERAIALQPDFPEALSNLGNLLALGGQLDRARRCLDRAIALKPDYAEAHNNLGNYFKDVGALPEAVACYRTAVALRPERADLHSNLILALHYHAGAGEEDITAEQRNWNARHVAALPRIHPGLRDRDPNRRLRVGYVSADLREHAVGLNLLPLFRHQRHDQFETFTYGDIARPDQVTAQFQSQSDHWRDTRQVTDPELAAQVVADRIDILVDLALHSAHNRLLVFARKPAPVQVSFAGYPGGTGVETIDAHLTDCNLEPGPAPAGSDAALPMLDSFWCYDPALQLEVNSLPASASGAVTFGCLNNFCKVNDGVLALWARVLLAVPRSRLLLLVPESDQRSSVVTRFAAAGISAARVELVGRQDRRDYLATYHRIDLGLDSFPYNGHTTSLDSYWMGVPVISLLGNTVVGRAGWSQLSNLQLTELVARSPDEFVALATQLAGDLPRLAQLRASLRARMEKSPLMNAERFARNIEAAYRWLWQRWCAQMPD
jgi:protein O-GlcNAc transferase